MALRAPTGLQASELASTQQQLMDHVERMFSSPAWRASPRQAELADAQRALAARSAEVRCQQPLECVKMSLAIICCIASCGTAILYPLLLKPPTLFPAG
jgi:hypothetical protein